MEPHNFVEDIWNKIIAQIPDTDKNGLNYTCKTLNILSKRTNHYIYTHSPLISSQRNLVFALLCATHYRNKVAVKNLLKHTADLNTLIHLPLYPLTLAEYYNDKNLIKLFQKYNAQNNNIMRPLYALASFIGDLPSLKKCMENDKDTPFEKMYSSNPFLHSAIFNGHTHIVEYILQMPSLHYLKDVRYHDMTTLYFAALNDRPAIVELLLKESPDKINDICTQNDFSALHMAAVNKYYYIAQLLLTHPNISVNIVNKDFNTPLHLAVEDNNVKMTKLFLSHSKINTNIINRSHKTPLDIANILQNKEIQQLLKAQKAKTYFYLARIGLWEQNQKT